MVRFVRKKFNLSITLILPLKPDFDIFGTSVIKLKQKKVIIGVIVFANVFILG